MDHINCLPFLALAIATRWDHARDGTSNYQGWDGFCLGFQPMFHYVSIDVHGTSLNRRCQAFDGHLATCKYHLCNPSPNGFVFLLAARSTSSKLGKLYDFWQKNIPEETYKLTRVLLTLKKRHTY